MAKATKKLTMAQVALVLDCIANVEGWCTEHACITHDPVTGWKMLPTGHPKPSRKLMAMVREQEGRQA